MRPARRDFRDKDQLAEALAEAVAGNLKSGVKARGAASLAVSGGSTPARFFRALSQRDDVPWDKVTVTLVDERWVPGQHPQTPELFAEWCLAEGLADSLLYKGIQTADTIKHKS